MQRRKYLIGLGSLAAGSAAALGSGAFTSVEADRTLNVAVADDANAFLALDDIDSSPNSEYVDTTGEGIVFNLDSTSAGGTGFNENAETRIDDLIQVTNQGTQTINVWVTLDGGSTFDDDTLYFYPGDATDTALNNGEGDSDGDDVLALTPGESAKLGVFVDLGDVSNGSEAPTATVHANVKKGASGNSTQVDDSGGDFVIVANDGSGDFSDLQTAIDSVSGSTILVKDTGTPLEVPEPLDVHESGLELRGYQGKPTLAYTGGKVDGELGVKISAADVLLETLRIEFRKRRIDSRKLTGGDPLFKVYGASTTVRDVDLVLGPPSAFDGPPGFADIRGASSGPDEIVFDNVLVDQLAEDGSTRTGKDANGNAWLSSGSFFSADTSATRRFVLKNSTIRSITVDAHPNSGQTIEILNNNFETLGISPEGIQPSPSGGTVTITGNSFGYTVTDDYDSNEKVKFTGLPDTVNGVSNPTAQEVADTVSTDNGEGDVAVLVLAGNGATAGNYTGPDP